MKTLKQLERLQKIHSLILRENTGTPSELATKIHVSERELYRLLEYLKEIGAGDSYYMFGADYVWPRNMFKAANM